MAERKLSIVINHLCAAHPLPLSLPESPLFKKMLIHACNTNSTYKPPNRCEMSGDLLEANYVTYKHGQLNKLSINVDTFGLGIFGDGATIVKVPMMNILVCSAGNISCVLDVVIVLIMLPKGSRRMHFLFANK